MIEEFRPAPGWRRHVLLAQERRSSPRIDASYPVRLRGIDINGEKFKEEALIENLSGGGMYVRLSRKLSEGTGVTVAIRLSTALANEQPAMRLAARGTVLRIEEQAAGSYGTAVEFRQRRVL